MWYRMMDRSKLYLRLYRKNNLSFSYYNKKWLPQKIATPLSIGFFRYCKTMGGYRTTLWFLGLSVPLAIGLLSSLPQKDEEKTISGKEAENRHAQSLVSTQYGYRTKIFGNIYQLIEYIMDSKVMEKISKFGRQIYNTTESEDGEKGLEGDMNEEDVRLIISDPVEESTTTSFSRPDLHPMNYPKTDDLSMYKIKEK